MTTRAPQDDIAPRSEADRRLQQSLNKMKLATSDYLDNPNNRGTEARFSSSSDEHARAMANAGLTKPAGEMRKVDIDFRNANNPSKKHRIAECLARSLMNMAVKNLGIWTISTAISTGGVMYALYEIGQNGRLVDVSDVNCDGLIDQHRIDVDYDKVPDYQLTDTNFDGNFDQLATVNHAVDATGLEGVNGGDGGGDGVELIGPEDGILEVVISFFSSLFG